MPTALILIGAPCSGKSHYIQSEQFYLKGEEYFVYSTDDAIEEHAERVGKTYTQLFQEGYYKMAQSEMNRRLAEAISQRKNIVWDQTNVEISGREKKINKIPDDYKKVAVFFDPSGRENVLFGRNKKRFNETGKYIPTNVLNGFLTRLERPNYGEGFDEIITIKI